MEPLEKKIQLELPAQSILSNSQIKIYGDSGIKLSPSYLPGERVDHYAIIQRDSGKKDQFKFYLNQVQKVET